MSAQERQLSGLFLDRLFHEACMNAPHPLDQFEEKVAKTGAGELSANGWERLREISTSRMQSDGISTKDRLRWADLALRFI
ncbi:hypothetical protein [Streptomyces roseolilacinus]|uniref:hypothetical protein n=1 Tax=Streptomyces roseolilacinus TaxID=66904 RepID=UPI003811207D